MILDSNRSNSMVSDGNIKTYTVSDDTFAEASNLHVSSERATVSTIDSSDNNSMGSYLETVPDDVLEIVTDFCSAHDLSSVAGCSQTMMERL